jgi:5'-nucleotidase
MRKISSLFIVLTLLSIFTGSGCSTSGNRRDGEGETASTEALPKAQGNQETIAILGTNDIHGGLPPQNLKSREPEGGAPVSYDAGGAAFLASYIRVLKGELGARLLWLDAGDEFQGTIESNLEKGAPMVKFFNAMGLQAAAIGNHEFDYGPEVTAGTGASDRLGALKARMSEAAYPYLAANILDRATGKLAEFPNTRPHMIFTVGKLRVGVVGLSTLDTPTTTRPENVASLDFAPLAETVVREAAALRAEGAQVVLATAHVGLQCERGRASNAHTLRKEADPQGECVPQGEMVRLLKAIPPGTLDAVVSGHSHQVVHHWVAGTPVIQGGSFGRYFNVIYLTYDFDQKHLVTEKTRIEGPVPVCPLVFRNQNDCNGDRPAPTLGRGPLVTPRFHGEKIEADDKISSLLKPVFARSEDEKRKIVGAAARPIDHERFKESPLGNLVADALRMVAKTDVAVMNSGGIRAPIEAGPITFGAVFRTLPFDNSIVRLKMTGKELKMLLRIAESGSRGFCGISGARVRVLSLESDAPSNDLDGDGKIAPWEVNRLLDARLADGSPIHENQMYTVGTLDFLVSGGDDMKWIMNQIPKERIFADTGVIMRDAVLQYVSLRSPLNTVDQPVVDPLNPRITFVTKKKGEKTKARRSRKKRKR